MAAHTHTHPAALTTAVARCSFGQRVRHSSCRISCRRQNPCMNYFACAGDATTQAGRSEEKRIEPIQQYLPAFGHNGTRPTRKLPPTRLHIPPSPTLRFHDQPPKRQESHNQHAAVPSPRVLLSLVLALVARGLARPAPAPRPLPSLVVLIQRKLVILLPSLESNMNSSCDGGHTQKRQQWMQARLFWAVLATGFAIDRDVSLLRILFRVWRGGGWRGVH